MSSVVDEAPNDRVIGNDSSWRLEIYYLLRL